MQLKPWKQWLQQQNQEIAIVQSRQMPGHARMRSAPTPVQLQGMYRQITAPIHTLHASNARFYQNWAAIELEKIKNDEQFELQNFMKPINCLLQRFVQPVAFKEYEEKKLYPQLEPSAPPLEDDYMYRASPPPLETPELEQAYTLPSYTSEWEGVVDEQSWQAQADSMRKDS